MLCACVCTRTHTPQDPLDLPGPGGAGFRQPLPVSALLATHQPWVCCYEGPPTSQGVQSHGKARERKHLRKSSNQGRKAKKCTCNGGEPQGGRDFSLVFIEYSLHLGLPSNCFRMTVSMSDLPQDTPHFKG